MAFSTPSILSLVGVAFWLWIKNRRPDATTLPALQVGLLLVIYSDFRDSACGTVSPNGRRDTLMPLCMHDHGWKLQRKLARSGMSLDAVKRSHSLLEDVAAMLTKQPHSLLFRNDIQRNRRTR
ncbi:hypothetical protein PLEOSDRAFT_170521 [Pleurotus ostreatus PC15]|uniref:Uncharacterized protein n=1 Tax=Pleurotus ostreatus (strain PC15) TaxID=1137138 RepID=A0A067NJY4_PLEO1|nr:hypothetical protein PLEOSDRAFT_170521 [Pleurotus ostreatus PC15]